MTTKRILTDRASAVTALAEVFREHGYEGASLSMISKATGLGKGSLYNFFPRGKEMMMADVLADIDQWFVEAIFEPLERADDPQAMITAMMDEVTSYFRSGGRVCLVGLLGLGSSRDAFAERVAGYFSRWITALARCLETAGVPSIRAAQYAEETVAGIQGAIVLAKSLDDKAVFERIIRRHQSSLVCAIINQRE